MESKPMVFAPGSAVEVSIDGGGFRGSWFSGSIVSHVDSDRFLVQYLNLAERAVVSLDRLRPRPPPELDREFKSGDNVEAFRNRRWWEGHVTEDLGNGSFAVSFTDSKEMALPKELLRARQEWINQNWVSPITIRNNNKEDIISKLPDDVLLHILDFMDTKDAIQTCVLSKRWKNLCKQLANITFSHHPYLQKTKTLGIERFKKFASWMLFSRDVSYSLHNLTVNSWSESELLDKVIKCATFCNVQNMTMYLLSSFSSKFESLPLIFCCQSLTSLKLCNGGNPSLAILPKSLHLPALKSLHLESVNFTTSDNHSAEPFSKCRVLSTLVLEGCSLQDDDARVLCISNSTLSSLTIFGGGDCQIVLSTPNICSFTIREFVGHQLFSTCDLSFLREVNIDLYCSGSGEKKSSVIMKWLQVLANVKILTIFSRTFQVILHELSNPISMRPQPPKFVRLESLRVNKSLFPSTSNKELNSLLDYLLQNSPMDRVNIISV